MNITGAVVGVSNVSSGLSSILGVVFILVSVLLFTGEKGLEERLKSKHTIIEKRKDGYHIYNTLSGENYSLNDLRELCKDTEFKRELRIEYFSDLLRLYSSSSEKEKPKYEMFISALSPNTSKEHLGKRLKQFENVYNVFKDKLEYRNPKRIERMKSSDFRDNLYVRFENEKDTLWPEEGQIDFLPFDEVKMNPSRGPLLSVIPLAKLIKDEYLLKDGETLNPKMNPNQRKAYLKKNYGIRQGVEQRNLVIFQIENDAKLQTYRGPQGGEYVNIVVDKKVPLVKVKKKK
jgi:hypothetical protein